LTNFRAETLSHLLPIMEDQVASHTHATGGIRSTPNIEELQARVVQLELDLREEKEARTRSELGMAQLRIEDCNEIIFEHTARVPKRVDHRHRQCSKFRIVGGGLGG
jgi:hypothetical protein